MKDYLKALAALKRICGLLRNGAEVDGSTVDFYIEDMIVKFKSQFGDTGDCARVVKGLEQSRVEVKAGNIEAALASIDKLNIMI